MLDKLNSGLKISNKKTIHYSLLDNEDGTIDVEKARQLIDFKTPQLPKSSSSSSSSALSKDSFIAFRSSHLTTKLYIRDITPTNPLSVLLFGGDFSYDLSGVNSGQLSHGIVIDNWLPIRTWCKNGVLIKHLRKILDSLIDAKLSNPGQSTDIDDDVYEVIQKIINL
ncbi:putative ATP-dependent RNA helicase [Candida tropicalis]